MKIGIMSMQRVRNYGSYLQAYGLKKTLEALGAEVGFIDYKTEASVFDRGTVRALGPYRNLRRFWRKSRPFLSAMTEEQKLNMIELFQQYTYKRSLATPFSDGSLSELGEELIYVFVYEDSELVSSVCISDADIMSVNDRTYVVRNASGLIQDILHIIDN